MKIISHRFILSWIIYALAIATAWAATTVFDQSAGMTNASSDTQTNLRQVFAPAFLTSAPGNNQIRVTFKFLAGVDGAYPIGKVYVGQMAATEPNFTGDQVQATFSSGGNTFNTPIGGGSVTSDWVTLAQNYDATKTYVVSFYVGTVPGNNAFAYELVTGMHFWSASSVTDFSSQTVPSPSLTQGGSDAVVFISKLEVQGGASAPARALIGVGL